MSRELTRSEFFAGFFFLMIQLIASFGVIWWNLNSPIIPILGFTDYNVATAIAVILGLLAIVVVGYFGENVLVKLPAMIGLWFVVAAAGYYLNLFTAPLILAETGLVTLTSIVIITAHHVLA